MKIECRIEPIVNLQTGERIGGEILSRPEREDAELFFRNISTHLLSQIIRQQFIQSQVANGDHGGVLFINLSVALLLDFVWLETMLMLHPGPKAIEIDSQQGRIFMHLLAQRHRELRIMLARHNAQLWFDDLEWPDLMLLRQQPFRFDGVKIDKHTFWETLKANDPQTLHHRVMELKLLTDFTLIEGIETTGQRFAAQWSGVDFAQGYLWQVNEQESFSLNVF